MQLAGGFQDGGPGGIGDAHGGVVVQYAGDGGDGIAGIFGQFPKRGHETKPPHKIY